jgi:hypothetical protein
MAPAGFTPLHQYQHQRRHNPEVEFRPYLVGIPRVLDPHAATMRGQASRRHRGSHISAWLLPIPKQFENPSAYFEKCLGNPVLRQLEKNTKVEKPLLVEAGRHG